MCRAYPCVLRLTSRLLQLVGWRYERPGPRGRCAWPSCDRECCDAACAGHSSRRFEDDRCLNGQLLVGFACVEPLLARLLCEHVDEAQPDLAFTVGMLLEYPVVELMERQGSFLKWVQNVRPLMDRERLDEEVRLFGCSHQSAFDTIAREWELPEEVVSVIDCYHKGKEHPNAELAPLVTVARWADSLGEALTTSASGPALEEWVVRAGFELRIREQSAWKLVSHVLKQAKAIAPSLGLVVCEQPSVDDLRRCRDVTRDPNYLDRTELVQWALMLQENIDLIEQKGEELNAMVETLQNRDELTELATHRSFLSSARARGHLGS